MSQRGLLGPNVYNRILTTLGWTLTGRTAADICGQAIMCQSSNRTKP